MSDIRNSTQMSTLSTGPPNKICPFSSHLSY